MARNDLAIRFTEEKYATRSEVMKELNMSMIDSIWSNILSYRSSYNRYLTIKSIEKNQLVVCSCPSIVASLNTTDMKLIRLMREYSLLNIQNGDLKRFEDFCLINSLKSLAAKHDIEVSDQYLRSLIHGDIRETAPSTRILLRYLDALNFIKKKYNSPIDVDFLGEIYSRLIGSSELTTFYRNVEDTNRENRVLIDRVYTSAPTILIDTMMDSLFDFIQQSTLSAACKASIAYYYVNYIKPFQDYSDEIAVLLAKSILAHGDLGEVGVLIPIESLLSENQEEIMKLFLEVQKTSDTTYFVNYGIKTLDAKCDSLFDAITEMKSRNLRADFYKTDDEKPNHTSYVVEQPSLFDSAQEESREEKKEQPAPAPVVVEQPKVEKQPEPQPEPLRQQVEQPQPAIREEVQEQIAVSYIPPAIDEKQALRLEQHLLELDPSLRKHEAKFYARHCTLGKSYTIAQYKRMIGCVYETARTAMDHLVELGYYRKDSSNKKFIYTPIPRR